MKTKKKTISVILPCLNEEGSIVKCIKKAQAGIKKTGLTGEVIVSDNGSVDDSVKLAKKAGAKVVHQSKKGYGNAYLKGLSVAKGDYIIIGDSDNTYDFQEIPRFIKYLEKGYDFVNGSRIKGKILPGAMPWLHRYVGVPVLTIYLNVLFGTRTSDAHCGLRAFTKDAYQRMELKTPGMEFASEMIIQAAVKELNIIETPITYYPRAGKSKLNSLRDGFRHLSFMTARRFESR